MCEITCVKIFIDHYNGKRLETILKNFQQIRNNLSSIEMSDWQNTHRHTYIYVYVNMPVVMGEEL